MNMPEETVVSDDSGQVTPARSPGSKRLGLLLCGAALILAGGGWFLFGSTDATSTDNAYVRGDITALAARVAGYVVAVEVQDNQRVAAGEVLFRIDDRDYRAHLAEAQANVAAAGARLVDVEAQLRLQQAQIREAEALRQAAVAERGLADKTHARNAKLIVHSAVSQALVDQSAAARSGAEASLNAAAATLEARRQQIGVITAQREAALAAIAEAEARRDLARIDLEHTAVRAPVAGVVGNRQVRVGRFVTPGTALLDLVPVDGVWVVANFKETQLARIQPGQPVKVSIDGYPDEPVDGVVDSFAPGSGSAFALLPADNATGNFVRVVQRVPVKIRLTHNPLPGRIVPGLSARVVVEVGGGA